MTMLIKNAPMTLVKAALKICSDVEKICMKCIRSACASQTSIRLSTSNIVSQEKFKEEDKVLSLYAHRAVSIRCAVLTEIKPKLMTDVVTSEVLIECSKQLEEYSNTLYDMYKELKS